jgi:hypothetical protein
MDTRDRVILPIWVATPEFWLKGEHEQRFDLAGLLLHLLLFDQVIVPSARLMEIPALVRTFGSAATIALLESGALRLRVGADAVVTMERSEPDYVQLMHASDLEPGDTLSKWLRDFARLGLPKREFMRLKRATARQCLLPAPSDRWGVEAALSTLVDATTNADAVQRAVATELRRRGIAVETRLDSVTLEIVDRGNLLLRFESRVEGVATETMTQVVRAACRAMAHLNAIFMKMKRDNAVTAIADDSVELMGRKLEFLWRRSENPQHQAQQFQRVVDVANAIDFTEAVQAGKLDVDRFLEVRKSPECRDFRAFLRSSDALTDKQLADATTTLRQRIGSWLKTGTGRTLRLLATTAAGMAVAGMPGAAIGAAASAVDSFVIETLLPSSGIVAFIGKQYPSIFE